jgi:folate-dependent tRNA-U54 methylase TrmFO/GidA
MNANFGLLDELPVPIRDKRVKRERLAERALADLRAWIAGSLSERVTVAGRQEDHAGAL